MPEASSDLSIIVFAFNEAQNVEPVLAELRAWLDANEPGAEILLVDDGSNDETAVHASRALAGCRHEILRHERNRGIGAAIKTGVAAATRPWITFLPADGQIEPAAIGTLRAAAKQHAADVVFSLYADRNDGLDRTVLSWGMRALVHAIHGVRLESDGPYLFRRALFRPEQLPSDSFFLNLEFPIRVLAAKNRTATVTIRCRPRRSGVSKSAKARVVLRVARELLAFRARRLIE
ncbi:MAG TPA: glycosyltransferase family 2 protein [Polyangiales bacterium]|nr:glycosyltransferase family 2 protein [Polyangiales bacterium]